MCSIRESGRVGTQVRNTVAVTARAANKARTCYVPGTGRGAVGALPHGIPPVFYKANYYPHFVAEKIGKEGRSQ